MKQKEGKEFVGHLILKIKAIEQAKSMISDTT